MERLTKNKPMLEMGMHELAYNSCYIDKDGNARYRDYETDVDVRILTRELLKQYAEYDDAFTDDDNFDAEMLELLMYGTSTIEGLIALFYRNLWAMAELREELKYYEDLVEQGRLVELPCKVGDTVYKPNPITLNEIVKINIESVFITESKINISGRTTKMKYSFCCSPSDFGKTVFLIKEEAEQALAEMKEV